MNGISQTKGKHINKNDHKFYKIQELKYLITEILKVDIARESLVRDMVVPLGPHG